MPPATSTSASALADYNRNFDDANAILLWLSIFGIACSAITIVLMYRLEVYKNSLMNIICVMTVLQFVYDFALIPLCGTPDLNDSFDTCRGAQIGFGVFTGVASAACTNVISALVCYVIYYRKRSYLSRTSIYAMIIVPSLIIGIMAWLYFAEYRRDKLLDHDDDTLYVQITEETANFTVVLAVYDYLRLVQLVLNLVFGGIIFYVLWKIDIVCSRQTTISVRSTLSVSSVGSAAQSVATSSSTATASKAYPMFLLAMRLIWYPIAQSVTRFGPSWFQISYNTTITDYIKLVTASKSPNLVTAQLYCYAITAPSAGIAYFFVFLVMQKGAWRDFCKPFAYIRNILTGSDDTVAKRAAAAIAANENKDLKSVFESDLQGERRRHNEAGGDDISSLDTDSVRSSSIVDDVYSSRESSLYDVSTSRNVSFSYQFEESSGKFAYDDAPVNIDKQASVDTATTESSKVQQRMIHAMSRQSSTAVGGSAIGLSEKDIANRAASQRLNSLRRRSSARHDGAQVSNVSAIIDYDGDTGDLENEVFDQLDEDELFELIVEQDVQEVNRRASARPGLSLSSSFSNSGLGLDTLEGGGGGAVVTTPLPVPGAGGNMEFSHSRASTIVEGDEAVGSASVPKSGFMQREIELDAAATATEPDQNTK